MYVLMRVYAAYVNTYTSVYIIVFFIISPAESQMGYCF